MPSTILSDNGVSSGTAGVKTTGSNDGQLALQTTTSGGTATTAMTIDTSQNVGIGTSSPARRLDVRGGLGMQVNEDGAGTKVITLRSDFAGAGPAVNVTTNDPLLFLTNNTEQARITAAGLFQFNSGYGSVATAYGCRAWVNFNGTGTVAIRASGNVSSITDNGTGEYTVNITTAMPDANYAVAGEGGGTSGQASIALADQIVARTTGAFRVYSFTTGGTLIDAAQINLAVFR
jgi:hypothetical protein